MIWTADRYRVSFEDDEIVLKLDGGNDCTTLGIYKKMTWNYSV